MQISRISNTLYNSPIKYQRNIDTKNHIAFTSFPPAKSKVFEFVKKILKPINKGMDKLTDGIACVYSKVLLNKKFKELVEWTDKSNINVPKHIGVFIAATISGTYVARTLNNKKLERKKRTTLAINQGIVFGLSTAMGYTFDKLANKKIDVLIDKFAKANSADTTIDNDLMEKYKKGMKTASSLIILATMYRYIAPVIVTPIANKIGNRVQAKREAELKAKQSIENK